MAFSAIATGWIHFCCVGTQSWTQETKQAPVGACTSNMFARSKLCRVLKVKSNTLICEQLCQQCVLQTDDGLLRFRPLNSEEQEVTNYSLLEIALLDGYCFTDTGRLSLFIRSRTFDWIHVMFWKCQRNQNKNLITMKVYCNNTNHM